MRLEQKETSNKTIRSIISDFLTQHQCGKGIELEARLGILYDKVKHERILLPVDHPVLFGSGAKGVVFKSGVSAESFAQLQTTHADVPAETVKDTIAILGNGIRMVQKDDKTIYERKTKLKTMTIYSPHTNYDIRITFSLEVEVQEDQVEEDVSKEQDDAFKKIRVAGKEPKLVRSRERTSYIYDSYQFDFTLVKAQQPKGGESSLIFEVEVEVKDENYIKDDFISIILNLARES